MKDKNENTNKPRTTDEATINFVSHQAQEAILNPNLDDDYKDWIVNAAVRKINRIADGKIIYDVRRSENQGSRTIRESEESKREDIPPIIGQLNQGLVRNAPEGIEDFTVEGIAERMGVNKGT